MKKDIYQEVTDYIAEALERVSAEDFKAPFARLAGQALPLNPMTGHGYQGINTLMLWFAQYQRAYCSNEWGTYKQWQEKGAQVKKGEKATMIIFYKRVKKKDRDQGQSGENGGEADFYHMLKSYNVFNADQVEGYEASTTIEQGNFGRVGSLAHIDDFIKNTGAVIKDNEAQPCFIPSKDEIHMPRKDVFFEENGQSATENYYAVLAHELTHWTGGKNRLDRDLTSGQDDIEAYAFEELIAELGAAFLCAGFGIKQQGRDDHAQYIKSWLTALRSDKKYIFKAAAQAQKAVDFLNKLNSKEA